MFSRLASYSERFALNSKVTYKELLGSSAQLARGIEPLLTKQKRVAYLMERDLGYPVC